MSTRKGMFEWVRNNLISTIKATGDIFNAAMDEVSGALSTVFKDTGRAGSAFIGALADIAHEVLRGALEIGSDLGLAAKGVLLGTLRATRETGLEALRTISDTAGAIVKSAYEVAGNLGKVAKGVVEGAIHAAKDLGLDVEDAASAAGRGALKAAYKIGATAGETVRNALTGTIAGVKVVLREPFKKQGEPKRRGRRMRLAGARG